MKLLTFVMRHLKNESIPQPLTHQFRKPRIMAQDLGQATQVKFEGIAFEQFNFGAASWGLPHWAPGFMRLANCPWPRP
jgi:hypothetical protein